MSGSMVEFRANGRTANGYLSLPATPGPGLLVIQEWWGLVDHIKDLADRFAAEGFVALAPDLFHGDMTKSPDKAAKMLMALNIEETGKDLSGAATYLLEHEQVRPKKIGALGFCMGGQLALFAASRFPDQISAAVDFYGLHPNVKIDASRVSGPVLAHFGKKDTSVPRETADALIESLEKNGKSVEAHFYDADHAFFNDTRPEVYNPEAADLAWRRTLDFLNSALR